MADFPGRPGEQMLQPGLRAVPADHTADDQALEAFTPVDLELDPTDPADSDLPLSVKDWTAADFSKVYVRFREPLTRHARRFLSDPTDADEVVQEAFLFLFLSQPTLDSEIGALRFLKWKTRLLALDVIRLRNRRPVVAIEDTTVHLLADVTPGASEQVLEADDAAIVRAALAQLSPRHRQALLLAEFEEKSAKEIGEVMGLDENATRQLLHRARKAMRTAIVGQLPEGASSQEIFSVVVKRAAEASKKAGKVALALLLVATGLSFLTNRNTADNNIALPEVSISASPSLNNDTLVTPSPEAITEQTPQTAQIQEATIETADTTKSVEKVVQSLNKQQGILLQLNKAIVWPGADANGIPRGTWVGNGVTASNALVVNSNTSYGIDGSIYTTSDLISTSGDVKVILNQSVKYRLNDLQFHVAPSVEINGKWYDLTVLDKNVEITKFGDIQVLATAWLLVDTSEFPNVNGIPSVIGVRIHTTEVGQPIFGQSVVLLGDVSAQ